MCMTINKKKFELLTAEKDITVYKVVARQNNEYGNKKSNTVISCVYKYIYVKNEINKTIKITPRKMYKNSKSAYIYEAYHFYIKKQILFMNFNSRNIAEFIIPKGSQYYIDKNKKTGVSSNIIFKKIIPNKNLNIIKDECNTKELKLIKI